MTDHFVISDYQQKSLRSHEEKDANVGDTYMKENMVSESIWRIRDDQYDIGNSSVAVTLSDLHVIDENSFYANNGGVSNVGDYDEHGSDLFTPLPLSDLKTSFLKRSQSVESESTANTSISGRAGFNYQQHQQYQLTGQQSPKRKDTSSVSTGLASAEDQISQSNNFTSPFSPADTRSNASVSSSDYSDNGRMTSNPFNEDINPTPINPYHNRQDFQQSFEQKNIFEEDELMKDDPKAVDELMASELNKLSFQERETINEEIHGIDVYRAGVKECPALLTESFRQLDIELQKLRPRYAAFDRSQRLFGATTYLNTEKLRVMFLRCDLFDIKKAAERLCNFAEVMLELYGDIALQRRPQINDLTDFEVSVLEAGNYTILPGRDRAGRRIIANLAFDAPEGFGYLQRCRNGAYVALCIMDDVETQQKGVVGLSWWHDVSVDDFMIRRKVHEKIKSLPMRMGAFHCCIPSEVTSDNGKKVKGNGGGISSGMAQLIKAMFVVSVGPKVRPHLRFHTGKISLHVEV